MPTNEHNTLHIMHAYILWEVMHAYILWEVPMNIRISSVVLVGQYSYHTWRSTTVIIYRWPGIFISVLFCLMSLTNFSPKNAYLNIHLENDHWSELVRTNRHWSTGQLTGKCLVRNWPVFGLVPGVHMTYPKGSIIYIDIDIDLPLKGR